MDTLEKVFLHQIMAPGLPGGITAAEAAAIRADQAAILALPEITGLDAIPDVSTAGVLEGQTLVYDADDPVTPWKPGTITGGLPQIVESGRIETTTENVQQIVLVYGLTTQPVAPGSKSVYVMPVYGGTGSAITIARSDHYHPFPPGAPLPFPASGSLSSGTRPLTSGTLSGLDPAREYRVWAALRVDLRGEGTGAGRSHPSVTLHGTTKTRFGGSAGYVRTVSGVDREASMEHSGIIVSGLTSLGVSAAIAHVDGDPKYIGGGELIVHVDANR